MTSRLIMRRARRDVGILVVWVALVAFAVAIAVGQPRLLLQTVNAGARQAVTRAGLESDVVVVTSVSQHVIGETPPVHPDAIAPLAAALPGRLPAGLRAVYSNTTLSVTEVPTQLVSINGVGPTSAQSVSVQLAMLTPQNTRALHLVQGALPTTDKTGHVVDVVVSTATADASGLALGSMVRVADTPGPVVTSPSQQVSMRVVGIVSESSGDASQVSDIPHFWIPSGGRSGKSQQIAVLTDESGIEVAGKTYSDPFVASLRIRLNPERFTGALVATVNDELIALAGHSGQLAGSTNAQLGVSSGFTAALFDFPSQERAATAQISVMTAGVLGVAAAVLLLVSRMLVTRREAELSLERARGASLPSIASRALAETAAAGVIATAIGLAAVQLLLPGPIVQPVLLCLVLAVALLAIPLQTILQVRGSWAGRKVPANRADRLELLRRARARRIAAEITILGLAIAAFVSLAARGLLETQTNGVDLLLASAPLLLAGTVAMIILRVYPWPVKLGISIGRRSNGALGLLAAVRAQRSIAILPLLALSLAVALAVGGGLLASTVGAGQESASWQRIGADVRVDSVTTEAQGDAIASAPGVTGATAFDVQDGIQLRLTDATDFATLVAVDSRFAGFVEKLPSSGASAFGAAALRKLSNQASPSDALPVVVNQNLAQEISSKNVGMYIGTKFVPMRVVGVTDEDLSGYLDAPFIFVNRAELSIQLAKKIAANRLLVNGPGARSAIDKLGAPKSTILTRARWLSQRQHLALVSGVDETIALATIGTAVLAVIALIVTLLSGARERGRSLALVRTLGLPSRLGWWLALAELAPVLLAGLIGGVVAGAGIVVFLEPAMGLGELAGGLSDPAPTISVAFIVGIVGAAFALLVLAVLIEVAVRRRDRLSEVLRVGEST